MIDYQTFQQIRMLYDQKQLTVSQIAEELGLDRKTVEKWAARPRYVPREGANRASKLDPFKSRIVAMLERHAYSAQQLFQQIRQEGFAGGYTAVKDFVRQVRPVRKPAFLMLQFAAGECAQIDWGQFGSVRVGSTRRRLSFFVMVCCYSRLMYVEFTLSESMEQFLSCHQHALQFFGGSPAKVMLDNLKVGVLRHPIGQPAQFHPRYLDFAAHSGFEPVACNPRQAQEKGRVENAVGYIKKNFLRGLEITSLEAVALGVRQWLDETANVRIHRETGRKPIEMFLEEKPLLRALPAMPYDCAVTLPVSVNRCCRVHFQGNRYSVPYLYASQKLTLKVDPKSLYLFHSDKLIATHLRCYDRGQNITDPDHHKELLTQRKRARHQTLMLRFLSLSPRAELFCRKIQEKRLNLPHHVQKILALSEIYGAEKVGQAIEEAIHFQAFGCEYIANLLSQRQNPPQIPSALHLTRHQDLLELEVPAPDLDVYETRANSQTPIDPKNES